MSEAVQLATGGRTEPHRPADLAFPLIAALGIGCGVTVILITVFNYFVDPMSADLGLSRTQVSGGLSAHTFMLIIGLPVAGLLADRYGSRKVILVSALLYATCFAWIARLGSSTVEFYAAFAAAGLLGAGAGPVSYARVIVQRFTTNRGLALGVALTANGLAALILPSIIRPVVMEQGWRAGFLLLAAIVACAGLIGGYAAGPPRLQAKSADATESDHGGLHAAMATSTFWHMTLAFGIFALAIAAVVAHLTEIFVALGLEASAVPGFQAAMGLATIAGRLVGGRLMDRMSAKLVGAGAALLGVAGFAMLALGHAEGMVVTCAAIALGLCSGAESDVVSYLSSHYFGVRRFARVYATQASFFMLGFGGGPLLFSVMAERLPATTLLLAAAALLLVSAVALGSLRPPRQP